MKYKIYKHTSPTGKVYIGQTSEEKLYRRWQYGAGYKGCPDFYADILETGWNAFTHEVIAETDDQELALLLERNLILQQDPEMIYNTQTNEYTYKRSISGTPKYYVPALDKYYHTYEEIGADLGGLSKQNVAYKIKAGNLEVKILTDDERRAMKG